MFIYRTHGRGRLVGYLLVLITLACATNTPVAQVPTPHPTNTSLPTFTMTPLPSTATPVPSETLTPIPSETPVVTETPTPTDTPLPATETPVPTDTPVPPPTNTPRPAPPPPTNTPVPTAIPASSVNTSPIAAPTNTPQPDTPPGRYEALEIEGEKNCFDMGVRGRVTEKGSDRPVQFATIRVEGEDDFKGPFFGKSDEKGDYGIYIGPIDDVGKMDFTAEVVGDGVKSEDAVDWTTDKDCHKDGAIQVMKINWAWKR